MLFSIQHITAHEFNPIWFKLKFQIRYYYHKIKYFGDPLKLGLWFEEEIEKQNKGVIESCTKVLKIMKKSMDLSKVRNL